MAAEESWLLSNFKCEKRNASVLIFMYNRYCLIDPFLQIIETSTFEFWFDLVYIIPYILQ